jgi:hypothetical protein
MFVLTIVASAGLIRRSEGQNGQKPPDPTPEQRKLVDDSRTERNAADRKLNGIRQRRDIARTNAGRIAALTELSSVSEAPVYELKTLKDSVTSVASGTPLDKFDKIKEEVDSAVATLKAREQDLGNVPDPKPKIVSDELAADRKLLQNVEPLKSDLDTTKQKLTESLQGIYTGIQERLAAAFERELKPLADLKPGDDAEKIRFALLPGLGRYPMNGRLWTRVEEAWRELEPPLNKSGIVDHAANKAAVDKRIEVVREKINGVPPKLEAWLKTLAEETDKRATAVVDRTSAITTGQARPDDGLLDVVEQTRNWSVAADQILSAYKDASAYLLQTGRKPDVDNAAQPFQALSLQSRRLANETSTLSELLIGDLSQFVGDQVRLFYFDDVPRLMYILNDRTKEIGGLAGAREQAATERRRLTESELDVSEAAQRVNNAQSRVRAIQEDLRQAKAQADSSSSNLLRTQRRLDDVQKKKDATEGEKQRAERVRDDAQRDADAANQRYDSLKDEQNGLPAQLAEARRTLEQAQADVIRSRRAATLAAQSEVEAFATARDNAPLWLAPATSFSKDPAKRVLMYAFNDSKTVFLRGTREDLSLVKEIIKQFDQPEPNARLTLWTLQLNSDGSPGGLHRFNDSLLAIEDELAFTRSQTAASISLLRDTVTRKAGEVGKRHETGFSAVASSKKGPLSRLYFYEQEVLDALGVDLAKCMQSGDDGRAAVDKALTSLPDPAGATTLGEALLVLKLAKSEYRSCIMSEFRNTLSDKIQLSNGEKKIAVTDWFRSLDRLLGTDLTMRSGISASQKELVHALMRTRIDRDLQSLSKELGSYTALRSAPAKANAGTRISNILARLRPSVKVDSSTIVELIQENRNAFKDQSPTSSDYARVAAADQMLKEMIIAFEDDVDRHFFQPMIQRLRTTLSGHHIGLRIIQRSSVLARNRLIARVDAGASAQLGLGEEHDILQATRQLAQMVTAAQGAGIPALLGGMQALPRNKGPELYGITNRGNFQVTPVIDPSGQALRFRFDHVSLVDVREPNGTTNPQLPRVDRHTVNTEVQVSNLELREVSRFEVNTKLGLPNRKSGGIPVLNEIPILRDIPLIGWFTRSGGRAGSIQESLIFAQTTIYPTIREMLELLISQVDGQ